MNESLTPQQKQLCFIIYIDKANRPFGIFVGLNHHGETAIFGATLMYDETILEAMSNKSPKTLFTDQDVAMSNACAQVMPDTYHRLCTWHILNNAIKHLSAKFKGGDGVTTVLSRFIDQIEEEDEFVAAWESILDKYNVRENTWLSSLLGLRKKWAKAYTMWSWSAGMKTTQLSESFNSSLKRYLSVDLDVLQFFKPFERILNDKRHKELKAEYDLCFRLPKVAIPVTMLVKAINIYTKSVFLDFEDQYIKSLDYDMISYIHDGDDCVYTVVFHGTSKERFVRKKANDAVSCSCWMFEMEGYLCRQAIKVLTNYMNVKEIPTQYILKRWTRKARSEIVQDMHGRNIETDAKLQETPWYKSICSKVAKISSRGSETKETYLGSVNRLDELLNTIKDMLSSKMNGLVLDKDDDGSPSTAVIDGNETCCLSNVQNIQAKGFKKKESTRGRKRIKGGMEKSLAKKKTSKTPLNTQQLGDNNMYNPMMHATSQSLPQMEQAKNPPSKDVQTSNYNRFYLGLTFEQSNVIDEEYWLH